MNADVKIDFFSSPAILPICGGGIIVEKPLLVVVISLFPYSQQIKLLTCSNADMLNQVG
jgi:hypothetical protein